LYNSWFSQNLSGNRKDSLLVTTLLDFKQQKHQEEKSSFH
jgi:hypothetical protein